LGRSYFGRKLNAARQRLTGKWRSITPLKKVRAAKTFTDIVNISLGIMCIAYPDTMYGVLPYLMGAMMVISGLASMAVSVIRKEYRRTDTRLTASGIISAVIGAIIILQDQASYGLVGVFWGYSGLTRAAGELNKAISRIATKRGEWARLMFFAVFGIVISIMLLADPVQRVHEHMVFIGIELIFIGFDEIDETYFVKDLGL